jgi:hypothetical protein
MYHGRSITVYHQIIKRAVLSVPWRIGSPDPPPPTLDTCPTRSDFYYAYGKKRSHMTRSLSEPDPLTLQS